MTLTADAGGEAKGSQHVEPPALQTPCPPGQRNEYDKIQWTDVVVVDTANGVTETVPGVSVIL
ncbi:MAG TPA: hypothetical protein VI316_00560 [Candidatus Dormibacteraeota bacterium]